MDFETLKGLVPVVLQGLGALVILATIVVQITGKRVSAISVVGQWYLKLIRFLPTIGVNPQTKLLEQQLQELIDKQNQTTAVAPTPSNG